MFDIALSNPLTTEILLCSDEIQILNKILFPLDKKACGEVIILLRTDTKPGNTPN